MQTDSHPIQRVIDQYEAETSLVFKPSLQFYQNIGINRIRFAQLLRGEKEPVTSELKSLSSFFKVPVSQLIN